MRTSTGHLYMRHCFFIYIYICRQQLFAKIKYCFNIMLFRRPSPQGVSRKPRPPQEHHAHPGGGSRRVVEHHAPGCAAHGRFHQPTGRGGAPLESHWKHHELRLPGSTTEGQGPPAPELQAGTAPELPRLPGVEPGCVLKKDWGPTADAEMALGARAMASTL